MVTMTLFQFCLSTIRKTVSTKSEYKVYELLDIQGKAEVKGHISTRTDIRRIDIIKDLLQTYSTQA